MTQKKTSDLAPNPPVVASIPAALLALFRRLSPGRRRSIVPLMALMLIGAIAEVVTIGALLPFLAVIADPGNSMAGALVQPILEMLDTSDPRAAVYVLTGLFALAAVVAAIIRLTLLWSSQSFVFAASYELAVKLYGGVLNEPYVYHTQRNTSEVIGAINKVQLVTTAILMPLIQGFISLVIALFIVAGLVLIDPIVALVAGVGFSAIYLTASVMTRGRLRQNSGVVSRAQSQRIKTMQEGMGGIRDILIDRSQPVFLETYERAEAGYRDARAKSAFLANSPRYLVETAGMILIALIAVVFAGRSGGLMEAIPALGALALGAQRLLPLLQQIYGGWASAMGNRQVLLDVATLMSRPYRQSPSVDAPLAFQYSIGLRDLGFSYSNGRAPALHGISLDIPTGARVGIAGKTGSGKSTLMDLILGLLAPTEGDILIDGVKLSDENRAAWQKNIAHVPQAIYLTDASIAENIAFGVRPADIDHERVRSAARQAELADVISALPERYDTRIGERGVQLSGGQRQRIGIARALYKNASVLVFDEATSALDNETESAVMDAIARLDRGLTLIIIAHRLSTLEGCDFVVHLRAGTVETIQGKTVSPVTQAKTG